MPGSVIVGGARTPIGKLSGALKGFVDLRGIASTSLLLRIADRRYLRAALPRLRIANDLTAGGIDQQVPRLLALPNVACVGGSWITPKDAVAAGDWSRIETLAREASQLGTT